MAKHLLNVYNDLDYFHAKSDKDKQLNRKMRGKCVYKRKVFNELEIKL